MTAFLTILTGVNCHAQRDALDLAVERRFEIIRAAHEFDWKRDGDYCYDGNRTRGSELGWRLRQRFGALDPVSVEAGTHDSEIAATFHESASAEYYYRYEKDWG